MTRTCASAVVLLCLASLKLPAQAATPDTLHVRVVDRQHGQPVKAAVVSIVNTAAKGTTSDSGTIHFADIITGALELHVVHPAYRSVRQRVVRATNDPTPIVVTLELRADHARPSGVTFGHRRLPSEKGTADATIIVDDVLSTAPVGNLHDVLNARVPSLMVTSGTQTGTGSRVRLRGITSLVSSNAPIWIIDGLRMIDENDHFAFPTDGNRPGRVGDINPDDIDQIDVLKGPAATALYGTGAVNGVIVLTSKRGSIGRPRWTVYTEGGLLTDRNRYPTAWSTWGSATGSGPSRLCTLTEVANASCRVDSTTSFNVMADPRRTPLALGDRRQVGVTVAGGRPRLQYFVSAEDEREIGVLSLPEFERERLRLENIALQPWTSRPNWMRRASLHANVNISLSATLQWQLLGSYRDVVQRYGRIGRSALLGAGTVSPARFPFWSSDQGYAGPSLATVWQDDEHQNAGRLVAITHLSWQPTGWWTTRFSTGVDRSDVDDAILPPPQADRISFSRGAFDFEQQTAELQTTLTYHALSVTHRSSFSAQRWSAIDDRSVRSLASGAFGSSSSGIGYRADRSVVGVTAQHGITWRDRITVAAGVRRDHIELPPPFVYPGIPFWAPQPELMLNASADYLLSAERWWRSPAWLESVRLRYAYGKFAATKAQRVASLRPEDNREHEVGVAVVFAEQRATLDATFYSKRTDNLIHVIESNTQAAARNVGAVANRGVEVSLVAQLVDRRAFGWDITAQSSTWRNEVLSLDASSYVLFGLSRMAVGFPLWGYWAAPITGWQDKNNDGILVSNRDSIVNEVFVGPTGEYRGSATPRFMTTLINGIEVFDRRLRFQTLWDWRRGGLWFNQTEFTRCLERNCEAVSRPGASLQRQAAAVASRTSVQPSTLAGYLESGNFLRLREASLRYAVPAEVATRLTRGRDLTLVLAARNLALWTRYSGTDPENSYSLTWESVRGGRFIQGSGLLSRNSSDAPAENFTLGPPTTVTLKATVSF